MKLKELLKHHNINWPTDAFRFEDRLAIYQKWADRPLPASTYKE